MFGSHKTWKWRHNHPSNINGRGGRNRIRRRVARQRAKLHQERWLANHAT